MDIQRLRNLTTGRLHTKIECIYEDLGSIIGEDGLMTHMLPRVLESVTPWLKRHVTDERFWNGEYDTTHTGEYAIPEPTQADRDEMLATYKMLPNPLADKEVVVVTA